LFTEKCDKRTKPKMEVTVAISAAVTTSVTLLTFNNMSGLGELTRNMTSNTIGLISKRENCHCVNNTTNWTKITAPPYIHYTAARHAAPECQCGTHFASCHGEVTVSAKNQCGKNRVLKFCLNQNETLYTSGQFLYKENGAPQNLYLAFQWWRRHAREGM
jgi:hypothetical protein